MGMGLKRFDSMGDRDVMYASDTSSTTGSSENSETFPGYRQITQAHYRAVHGHWMGAPSAKVQQQYKGQLKLAVYVNYGLITVHVVMARHLKSKSGANCTSYVKLAITPDENKSTRCKSDIQPETNSPLYDEKFSFELLSEDVEKRLNISVWNRISSKGQCEFLGSMSFGIRHIYNQTKTVSGWYYLLPGDIGKHKHLMVSDFKQPTSLTDRRNARTDLPPISADMLWADTHTLVIKRSTKGYCFTICGAAPVTVKRIEVGSYAERIGLQSGDRIVRIDGIDVARSNTDQVARIIKHSANQVILEIQRPRQLEPEVAHRSPYRPHHSTPERRHGDVMDTDSISPWRRSNRHRPYTSRNAQNACGRIRGHSGSVKSLPMAANEPIYAEPSFPHDARHSDVASPQVKHYDYGWVDGHDENKENVRAITEIPDRYFATAEDVDDDDAHAQAIDSHYRASAAHRQQQLDRFESSTLPRNMTFRTSKCSRILTHASSVKSLSRNVVTDTPHRSSSTTKDYGWIDSAPKSSDHTSQSSGYSSATLPQNSTSLPHKTKLVTNV